MIYVIPNKIAFRCDYVITDESAITTTSNTSSYNSIVIGTESDANTILEKNKQDFLAQESYRFSMVKEQIEGDTITWMSPDLDNDPEETVYQVFNQFTGVHERFESKLQAIARREEIKQQFIVSVGLGSWTTIEKLP